MRRVEAGQKDKATKRSQQVLRGNEAKEVEVSQGSDTCWDSEMIPTTKYESNATRRKSEGGESRVESWSRLRLA